MKLASKATAISEFVERLSRRALSASRNRELSRFQWSALRHFARAHKKARTIGGFAAAHSISLKRALRIVGQLKHKHLAKSCKPRAVAQAERIEVTAAGTKRLRQDPQVLIKAALTRLSVSERRVLLTSLKRASAALTPPANRVKQLLLSAGTGMFGYAATRGQHGQNALAQSACEMLSNLA